MDDIVESESATYTEAELDAVIDKLNSTEFGKVETLEKNSDNNDNNTVIPSNTEEVCGDNNDNNPVDVSGSAGNSKQLSLLSRSSLRGLHFTKQEKYFDDENVPTWLAASDDQSLNFESGVETRLLSSFPFFQDDQLSLLWAPDGGGKSTWLRIFIRYFLLANPDNCVVFLTENIITAKRDQTFVCGNPELMGRYRAINCADMESLEGLADRLEELMTYWVEVRRNSGKLLLVCDTLTKLAAQLDLDTNLPRDMGAILKVFGNFRDDSAKSGVAVHTCLSYHPKKNDPKKYSGAKEISNQCNARLYLTTDQESFTTTIEVIGGQALNKGETKAYKLGDKVQATKDFDVYTTWQEVEASADSSERTEAKKETAEIRKGVAAVAWWLANRGTNPFQKDIRGLCGWGTKRGGNLGYEMWKGGYTTAYSREIGLVAYQTVNKEDVDNVVNDLFEGEGLSPVSVSVVETSDGSQEIILRPKNIQTLDSPEHLNSGDSVH